jgi:hypothetical protein
MSPKQRDDRAAVFGKSQDRRLPTFVIEQRGECANNDT